MNECHICKEEFDIGYINGKLQYTCLRCKEMGDLK